MVDSSSDDVFTLLKKICSLQEERAYTYRLFEEGHKIYLSTAPNYDFPTFRELVREVTQEFKRISEGMMDIERRLRLNDNSGHLAEYVRALQEEEKVKLELFFQAARRVAQAGAAGGSLEELLDGQVGAWLC
ncbi:required for excision 1-B domain-containing protein-like isoform X2 [Dermacentor albipictus]|uniref:required for excision 1-B domain-containing protein-like isoform X2 n=1 Tax=Dermacentor albipictus TaxID=60249 RepID=UPI0031FC7AE8